MVTITNSYDEKIMNFDVAEGYETFMALFSKEEVEAMAASLKNWGFTSYSEEDLPGVVISAYVEELFMGKFYNRIDKEGSQHLFNLIFNVL